MLAEKQSRPSPSLGDGVFAFGHALPDTGPEPQHESLADGVPDHMGVVARAGSLGRGDVPDLGHEAESARLIGDIPVERGLSEVERRYSVRHEQAILIGKGLQVEQPAQVVLVHVCVPGEPYCPVPLLHSDRRSQTALGFGGLSVTASTAPIQEAMPAITKGISHARTSSP